MDEVLLDTDILNEVLKQKNAVVVLHAADYLAPSSERPTVEDGLAPEPGSLRLSGELLLS